jgi:mitochondrial inner membrane protease subunit 1
MAATAAGGGTLLARVRQALTLRTVARYVGEVVSLTCAWHLLSENVAELTMCVGPSMLPTLHVQGDVVVVEHVTARYRPLRLGDVVVARSPGNPRQYICKRVLGLPGDLVCADPTRAASPMVAIPPGHVWLQGDNLHNSSDSRAYGPVPLGLVKGRVVYRVWPPRAIGPIPNTLERITR